MRAVWLRRVGFSLSLALALGYLPYRIYRKSGLSRYMELRAELAQLKLRNDRLRTEALRLRAELEAFGPPEADRPRSTLPLSLAIVERAARDELGLVRPGELVFQIVPDESASAREVR
jgi:cell division protein FtsB